MNKKLFIAMSMILILALSTPGAMAQDLDSSPTDSADIPEHVPGEILIGFNPGVNSAQAKAKLAELGLQSKRRIPSLKVHLVELPPGLSVEKAIDRFSHLPGVEYAEPNYILQLAADPPVEVTGQWELVKIQAQDAWNDPSMVDKNVVLLATVDTGIDKSHTDLAANVWKNPGETGDDGVCNEKCTNGVDDDGNGYIDDWWGWDFVNNDNDPFDDNLHGTAVSSLMAGVKDNGGIAGVCHWCQVMAVKVMSGAGTGTLDAVASGIIYAADKGAKGINLSLVGATGSATLENAVNYAWDLGALVVAGAGNNGANAFMYPAGYANAMAIASTDSEDQHSCFSNYADGYISVSAPGEEIVVAMPNQSYGVGSGTSLSTPLVTGLGGLLFSQDESRTNSDVRALIENTAEDLSPPGLDAAFGYGRINSLRAVTNDDSPTNPPGGRFSTNNTASGYAHARKLVRDSSGTLHMIWHTQEGSEYQIRYASSSDNGANWNVQDIQDGVFSSNLESYHPALATDNQYLYVAIPSRSVSDYYQILFTRKPINGGEWSIPQPLMGGTDYHAVRPDLYVDPTNGRLHLVASSLDNTPYIYYLASGNKGISWDGQVAQVNPSIGTVGANSNTRYASVHANGDNIYIVSRTVSGYILVTYYMHTVRSTDGGQTWFDQTKISSFLAITSGEYGISIAGVGDRLYMGYEVGSNLYFRYHNGTAWSGYETLELGDANNVNKWPSITQAQDGQAWMLFEVNGEMFMRHYDGTTWEAKESIGPGNYANLKLGTNGDQVEWIYTSCNGAPFLVKYDSRTLGANSAPVANDDSASTPENTPVTIDVAANDSDPNGNLDPSSANVTSDPTNGSVINNGNGTFTYTPDMGFNGSDVFDYEICDSGTPILCDTAIVSITVTAANNPPVAVNDTYSINEDTTLDVAAPGVLGNDTDVESDPLTAVLDEGSNNGSLTLNANGSFAYTPNANFNGLDTFTYHANDRLANSNVATVTIIVNAINDNPVANDDSASTPEDTPVTIDVDANDSDPDGNLDPASANATSAPVNGSVTSIVAGTFKYTPNPDFNGSDSFVYEICDSGSPNLCDTASVTITVNPVNDPPVANNDSDNTPEDTPVTIDVSANDSDPDGNLDLTSANATSAPVNGSVTSIVAGTFTYTPNTDFNGSDGFVYEICDTGIPSLCDTASVSITIDPVNDPPVAIDINETTLEESLDYWQPDVSDVDNEPLTCSILGSATEGGTVTIEANCGTSSYEPPLNFYGTDSFIYQVCDESLPCDTGTVTYTVTSVSLHVGDLDAIPEQAPRSRWNAVVKISVIDALDLPVINAEVSGSWSAGATGGGTCTTDSSGSCDIYKNNLKSNVSDVTFTVDGISHATLTYKPSANDDPDSDSDGTTIIVYKDGIPSNQPPVASFTYDCTDLSCDFDASGSYDPDGSVSSYAWDYGDGNGGTGVLPSHSYGSTGIYTVVLTVTDDGGANSIDTQQVNVGSVTQTMHVGDIDGYAFPGKRDRWNATATVTIHSEYHTVLEGATISGTWSNGRVGNCTTNASGECSLTLSNIKSIPSSVTFSVTNVTAPGWEYNSIVNHDYEEDSNGTSIDIDYPPS